MEKEPILGKIPKGVLFIILILFLIYGLQFFSRQDAYLLYNQFSLRGGGYDYNQFYRFFTYGFVHIDFSHILLNSLWLLIFAVPFVQHFSFIRFLLVFCVGITIAGFITSYVLSVNDVMIGASAGVSAVMAASMRFILKIKYDFRGQPMLYALFDRRYLFIMGFITGIDILNSLMMEYFYNQVIGWQAHFVGGVVGAVLMSIPWFNKDALFREREI